MENKEIFLSVVPFSNLVNWSVRFLQQQNPRYKRNLSLFKIGDFLKNSRKTIIVEDEQSYKQVTIKLYNKGVELRGVNVGKNIGTKKQYRVASGQFIISKIDARNGAFGIVPSNLEGAIVTADFIPYDIDTNIINAQFLVLLTSTKYFTVICQKASSGTTGRQRVNEKEFLQIQVPLPDLDEQNKIVMTFNHVMNEASAMEEKANELESDADKYICKKLNIEKNRQVNNGNRLQFIKFRDVSRWAISHITKKNVFSLSSATDPVVAIRTLLTAFEGGKTPSKSRNDYWLNGSTCWASPKDFNGFFLTQTEDKITASAVDEAKMKVFPPGTILGVFRSGILRHSFPVMMTQIETSINQDVKAMTVNEKKVNSTYLLYYLKAFEKMILERASKIGVTVESINSEEFLDIPVVLPPLDIQAQIVEQIKSMKDEISSMRASVAEKRRAAFSQFEMEIFRHE